MRQISAVILLRAIDNIPPIARDWPPDPGAGHGGCTSRAGCPYQNGGANATHACRRLAVPGQLRLAAVMGIIKTWRKLKVLKAVGQAANESAAGTFPASAAPRGMAAGFLNVMAEAMEPGRGA